MYKEAKKVATELAKNPQDDYVKKLNDYLLSATQDHYLFKAEVLDLYCLTDEYTYKLIASEEELLKKVKEQFLDKGLFEKNNDDQEIKNKSEALINLLTSSFKNKNLFFYCQLMEYGILNGNDILTDKLDDLIESSKGSARFKEFAKERIINVAKSIGEDNNYKNIITKLKTPQEFKHQDIKSLIEGNVSYEVLQKAMSNIADFQGIDYDINKLFNHPEARNIIAFLKAKNIDPATITIPDFSQLIDARNFAFLDILLSNFSDYFSVTDYFSFPNDLPLQKKLGFIDWLDNKINDQSASEEVKNHLVNIIKANQDILPEILLNQRKDFMKYWQILTKNSQNDQDFLFQLLSKEYQNKKTPLHFLARKGSKNFLETIEFLATKQEGQESAFMSSGQLVELLSKEDEWK